MAVKPAVTAAQAALARKEGPTTPIAVVRKDSSQSDHVPGDKTFHVSKDGGPNILKNQGDTKVDQQVVKQTSGKTIPAAP